MSKILINKFKEESFGSLTTLTSKDTGKVMFIAKEVAELWGHSNINKAIKDAELNSDEVLVLTKKEWKLFFSQLSNQQLVGHRASSVQLVTESGLYKLAMTCRISGRPNVWFYLSDNIYDHFFFEHGYLRG